MSDQYFPTTRLSNVIKLIMLGNQTGLLHVKRTSGTSADEGQVQFVSGQIELAAVGHLTGQAALAVLQTWGEATYQFLDGVNQLPANWISRPLVWSGLRESATQPPPGSGSLPNGPGSNPGVGSSPYNTGMPQSSTPSQPTSGNSNPGMSSSGPGLGASQPNGGNYSPGTSFPPGPIPRPNYPPPGTSFPPTPGFAPPRNPAGGYPSTGSFPSAPNSGSFPPGPGTGSFPPGPGTGGFSSGYATGGFPPTPGMFPQAPQPTNPGAGAVAVMDLHYVPRRQMQLEQEMMYAMDRRERQLLLLIDGRRTVNDLVRLTRRTENEVQTILAHLLAMSLVI